MTQAPLNGRVVFAASDGVSGVELWQTNGTREGTVRVADIAPGAPSSNPSTFTIAGSKIFFAADDNSTGGELWSIDRMALTAPVALDGSATVAIGHSVSGRLSAVDLEGDALTYSIVANASRGVAVVTNATTGDFTYTWRPGAQGRDSFSFKVNDGQQDSNIAIVTVTIDGTMVYLPLMRH